MSLLAIAVGFILTACIDQSASDGSGTSDNSSLAFGQAGHPSESDRTIEVVTLDTMAYEPDAISVSEGETITFEVTNSGIIPHEFAIGDEAEQTRHAEEMADPAMATHDHPFSVYLEAGETKEIVWEFTVAGEFLYGCHVPGHYEAGMKGPLVVE